MLLSYILPLWFFSRNQSPGAVVPPVPFLPFFSTLFQNFLRPFDAFGVIEILRHYLFHALHHVVVLLFHGRLPHGFALESERGLALAQFAVNGVLDDPRSQDGKQHKGEASANQWAFAFAAIFAAAINHPKGSNIRTRTATGTS